MARKLTVQLTALTAPFKRGMKSAAKSVGTFAGRAKKAILSAKGLGAALLAITTTSAAVKGLKQAFDSIDKLAKTADKLGATTKALAGLRHAAELTGAGARTADTGLQRMVRRISEAADGAGAAKGALEELGLNAQELEQLPIEEQFMQIADAMNQTENASDRVRLAMKLFDTEGVSLVNTLALGRKGLQEAIAEADNFGSAISRVDAAQIEMANDAILRVKTAFKGLFNQFAVALAPMITKLANWITALISETSTLREKIKGAIQTATFAIADLIDRSKLFKVTWVSIKGHFFAVLFDMAKAVQKFWQSFIEATPEFIRESFLGDFQNTVDRTFKNLKQLAADAVFAQKEILDEMGRQKTAVQEVTDFYADLDKQIADTTATAKKLGEQQKKMREEQRQAEKAAAEAAKKRRKMMDAVKPPTPAGKPGTQRDFTGQFLQRKLREILLPTGESRFAKKKVQEVKDPQLAITNELLNRIALAAITARVG